MNCPKCHAVLPNDSEFCQYCGTNIKTALEEIERKNFEEAKSIVGGNAEAFLKRGFMALEDEQWQKADVFFEGVLNQDAENAQAHLGKLMAELHVKTQDDLKNCDTPFDGSNNYRKVIRFADPALAETLKGYITSINERNENARLTDIYNRAKNAMNEAKRKAIYKENAYIAAADLFATIPGYEDADVLAEQCREKAVECREKEEECHKNEIYNMACANMDGTLSGYESAIKLFQTISGWKDVDEQIVSCQKKTEEIKEKQEIDRKDEIYERANNWLISSKSIPNLKSATDLFESIAGWKDATERAEACREKIQKIKEKARTGFTIAGILIVVIVAFAIVYKTIIIPLKQYNQAIALKESGQYDEAITAFMALDGFKDSESQIAACQTAIEDGKYDAALALKNAGKYNEAIAAFQAMNGYRDSADQITSCETALYGDKYDAALTLKNAGKYNEAITAFKALNGYRDSAEQITACQTAIKEKDYNSAQSLMNDGNYESALTLFQGLNGYRDSAAQITICENKIRNQLQQLINNEKYTEFIAKNNALGDKYLGKMILAASQKQGFCNYLSSKLSTTSFQTFCNDVNTYKKYFNILTGNKDAQNILTLCDINKKLTNNDYITLFKNNMKTIVTLWDTPVIQKLLLSDYYINYYMLGKWSMATGYGEYLFEISYKDNVWWCSDNLPHPDAINVSWRIENLVFIFIDMNFQKIADVYKFTFISANKVQVYCYKDSSVFTLTRSSY